MDSGCVYEQQRVINELTQGIQMAKDLRANLNSAEARKFFIQKILSSYHNALSALKSGDSSTAWATTLLPAQSLPDSSISNTSTESEFDQSFFDHQGQNVVSRKRNLGLTGWEDQVRMYTDNVLEMAHDGKRACNQGAGRGWAASPPQPTSPENFEIKPTHNNHDHEFSLPAPSEALSNLRANLSVDITSDFSTIIDVPSMFSIPPSTPSVGFSEEGFQQLHFPNYIDDELLQVCSPFISPNTSAESNYFSEWGSSQSLDFSSSGADHHPAPHVDDPADFLFGSSSFFLDSNNDDPKFCRQLSLVDWDPTFLG
uniref:uncharacterized protein LOC122584958 n=1 Tax=Erigeron canadensis TaxID=72917 RepID=UPI001CB9293E|nr:uncharacterized protein LOC122584958 [Erigeron canadensis]